MLNSLDAAKGTYARLRSIQNADRYLAPTVDSLRALPPFCPLEALYSILKSDASLRPQAFVGQTNFRHKPTETILEGLAQIVQFLAQTYGPGIVEYTSLFPSLQTAISNLKADSLRLDHIIQAGDDTFASILSANDEIRALLERKKRLEDAINVARSLVALKATTALIDQLISQHDLPNAGLVYSISTYTLRTLRNAFPGDEALSEELQEIRERLEYQLRYQISAVLFGGRDAEVALPCRMTYRSAPMSIALESFSYTELCFCLRGIVARACNTTDLLTAFSSSLGILYDAAIRANPLLAILPERETLLRSSTVVDLSGELYSLLLGHSLALVRQADIEQGSVSILKRVLRGVFDNLSSSLAKYYTECEMKKAPRRGGSGRDEDSSKAEYAPHSSAYMDSIDLRNNSHVGQLRTLLVTPFSALGPPPLSILEVANPSLLTETVHAYLTTANVVAINLLFFYLSIQISVQHFLAQADASSDQAATKPTIHTTSAFLRLVRRIYGIYLDFGEVQTNTLTRVPSTSYALATAQEIPRHTGNLMSQSPTEPLSDMNILVSLDNFWRLYSPGILGLMGVIYETAVLHVAELCACTPTELGYTRDANADAGRTFFRSGLQTQKREATVFKGSLFSLDWTVHRSTTHEPETGVRLIPSFWHAFYIEKYLLSFFYCNRLLNPLIRIEIIDDVFRSAFNGLRQAFWDATTSAGKDMFSLVPLENLAICASVVSSSQCAIMALQGARETPRVTFSGEPWTERLIDQLGQVRVSAFYLLQPVFNYLHKLSLFANISYKYFAEYGPALVENICSSFLRRICQKLDTHYKNICSYALLFCQQTAPSRLTQILASYETNVRAYVNGGCFNQATAKALNENLCATKLESFISIRSPQRTNVTAEPEHILATIASLTGKRTVSSEYSQTASQRMKAAGLSARSTNLNTPSPRSSHSFSTSAFSTVGHGDAVEGLVKNLVHTPGHHRNESDVSASTLTLGEEAPVQLLASGSAFAPAMYSLQACLLVYTFLTGAFSPDVLSKLQWTRNLDAIIHKLICFILLELRLQTISDVSRGIAEDIAAQPDYVTFPGITSFSDRYHAFVQMFQQFRAVVERLDLVWLLDHRGVFCEPLMYAARDAMIEELARNQNRTLLPSQVARIEGSIQLITTVVPCEVDMREIVATVHVLGCAENQ
ncbi:hypothetical protein GMRT_16286 [Giardia muris]|uniref:Uncharacterized protein n=1 Tax=Giardia muris TaxID=5742 RepID=A0A4Z1SUR5_GIAMU|nr:hypothetical protein GMRT_16286 [Giardia muris]|eukprot:TNJ29632.1 hypothetical protein GMRT_16286 [Giardia muris]